MQTTWLFIDFDNTLMATEQYALPSLIDRFNALYAAQIGRNLTLSEFKQHFHGQTREALCDNLSEYFKIPIDYPALYEAREWCMMQHLQALPTGVEMAPGLIETLSEFASKNVNLALVSNNPIQRALTAMRFAANQQGEKLARLFGTHYFEAGETPKPLPDVYLHAISQTQAIVKNSFAVEDSVTGATAAIKAGLKTFGFVGFADNPLEAAQVLLNQGCIATFEQWSAFPALFYQQLENR